MSKTINPRAFAIKTGSPAARANTRNAIRDRRDFATSGAMRGERGNYASGFSRLRGEALDAWKRDVDRVCYVVYSYETPIAWFVKSRGWVLNRKSYSPTTGTHQSAVQSALMGYGCDPVKEPVEFDVVGAS